jgi:CubicO group peptidase (beta-lactamase class C family)
MPLPTAAQSRAAMRSRIDSLVTAFQRATGTPGISVAVIRAGRDTIVFRGYGLANREHDVPATAQTVYRIGSITKQFTAASVLKLAEQGQVSLDATLGEVLPQTPSAWHAVTVRQLLNHSGGIPEVTEHPRWVSLERLDASPDSILALVANDSLEFRPGTRVAYSNTGYILLGMLIEKLSGRHYAEYLASQLFRPFGLSATAYCDEQKVVKGRAQGYARIGDTIVNARDISMTRPFAAGALCSTVGDLARWNYLLATGRVVTLPSFAMMTTPEGPAVTVRYGFGIWAKHFEGRIALTHDGAIAGFRAVNGYLPQDSLSVTVLANSESANSDQLARLHRMIMRVGIGLPAVPRPVTLSAAERARYVGRYEARAPNGEVEIWQVTDNGGSLSIDQIPVRTTLIPYGNDVFGSIQSDTYRLQFTMQGEHATEAELLLPELRIRARRVP